VTSYFSFLLRTFGNYWETTSKIFIQSDRLFQPVTTWRNLHIL